MDWKNPSRPYAIAHRGASAYAPEGSIEAYRKASQLGADFWEIDIRMASCKTLVCCHDANLPDGTAVAKLSAVELAALKVAVPLNEVLMLGLKLGAGIYAEIKDMNALLPTLDALKSYGIQRAVIGSFDQNASRILGNLECPFLRSVLVPLGADPFAYAKDTDIVHLCWENMTRRENVLDNGFFAEAHRLGYKIALWNEDSPHHMNMLRHLPVFGICSDRPELVHPFLPPANWPLNIVCHRGATEFAPENTLAAVHCGLAAGFQYIEIDVRTSRDGSLVVMHDETLDRTTNGIGSVSSCNEDMLLNLDAGSWLSTHFSNETVPSLDNVLELTKYYGGNLYVEIKSADPKQVLATIEEWEMLPNCFFWSFDYPTMEKLRLMNSDTRVMVRRQDYSALEEVFQNFTPEIIEFTLADDWGEIAYCQARGAHVMIVYSGWDTVIFDCLIEAKPDYLNLHFPFAFRNHLQQRSELYQDEFL